MNIFILDKDISKNAKFHVDRHVIKMITEKHNNPIKSYRNYYLGEKRKLFKWKNRNIPYWINHI